jgi:DUF177 domain-containing protein
MRYNVAQLIKGPTGAFRQYDLQADIRDLDAELEPVCPLEGTVTLLRTSQGILVTGKFTSRLRMECRRCLEPCDVDVELELEEEFYPIVRIADAPVDDVPETDRDEALRIDEHHILDLGEVIRQALWLAAPMEALCRPDCAGICPRCGGNRNLGECQCDQAAVDPRWVALQALITNEPDS